MERHVPIPRLQAIYDSVRILPTGTVPVRQAAYAYGVVELMA